MSRKISYLQLQIIIFVIVFLISYIVFHNWRNIEKLIVLLIK